LGDGFVIGGQARGGEVDRDEPSALRGQHDEAVAQRLIREAGVAAIPPSVFYRDNPERGYLRLCFAKEDATLDAAIERLAEYRLAESGG
jgi:aspartate/methionine/tyrosine aminotransferase